MLFREATKEDLEYVARYSVSRGNKEYPDTIDYIYTLENQGVVLGVGGFKLLNENTAWVWLDFTPEARVQIRIVYHVIVEWMQIFVKNHGLRLLMAAVRPLFTEAIMTIEHLGFHKEATMPNFFGDQSAHLYLRLYEHCGGINDKVEQPIGDVLANKLDGDNDLLGNHN